MHSIKASPPAPTHYDWTPSESKYLYILVTSLPINSSITVSTPLSSLFEEFSIHVAHISEFMRAKSEFKHHLRGRAWAAFAFWFWEMCNEFGDLGMGARVDEKLLTGRARVMKEWEGWVEGRVR